MTFSFFKNIRLAQTTFLLMLGCLLSSSAECETYKWVDDKGVMSFSDNLSSVPPRYRKQISSPADTDEPIKKSSLVRTRSRNSSGPLVKETYDYYEIRGRTENELQQQMNASGIQDADGNSYYAYTSWYIRWNYTYNATPKNCSIATVATSVDVNYKLPKWVNSEDSTAALKNKWHRFVQNLELHEYGHKEIGLQTAGAIERSIAALKPRTSCEELGVAANSLGQQLIEESKPTEADYDLRTSHGRTQGANFP